MTDPESPRVVRSHPDDAYIFTNVTLREDTRKQGIAATSDAADLLLHAANVMTFLGDEGAHVGDPVGAQQVRSIMVLCGRALRAGESKLSDNLWALSHALRRSAPGHVHPDLRQEGTTDDAEH